MVFGAFLGPAEYRAAWQTSMRRHAARLGLACHEGDQPLGQADLFAWGWLLPSLAELPGCCRTADDLRLTTTRPSLLAAGPAGQDDNLIHVRLVLAPGQLHVVVPVATPEPFYYARDHRGWMLGNDLRLLTRWAGFEVDERGVYGLFQYGAIPAPITLARGIQRIPTGFTLVAEPNGAAPSLALTRPLPASGADPVAGLDASRAETRVQQTLESMLGRTPPAPALFFSGGVDSSLLAAQLVGLGVKDVQLINYSFGPDDPEAQQARRVADYLGLPCEQVAYRPQDILPMLERIGHDYSFPFGDRSVIPTNLLVRASVGRLAANSVVIEGTGADGAFGPWAAHSRVAALPRLARRALAGGHAWLRLWQQASEAERVSGLARGSLQMPVAHAFVAAQNVLDGIAYTMPKQSREALEQAIHEYVEVHSLGLEAEQRLSLLDLVHVCAGIFAAKTFDPLRAAGLRPVYPFLEPPMVWLSAALPYAAKTDGRQGKIVLKRLLARHLPRELIERPKSGFIPPMAAILTDPAVQAYARAAVLSAENPLRPFYHVTVVEQLFDRAAAGRPLSKGSYKFLWSLIFASCWLRQVEC